VRGLLRLRDRFNLRRFGIGDLKTASLFTASGVAVNIANLAAGILIYRWIEPELMGIWQTMVLVQTYCSFLTLGIAIGMNR